MAFSLIHYREIDGAYNSKTSNTVAMYSANIWFLRCNREIKIIYLIPDFHLDGICFVSQPGNIGLAAACAQLSGTQEGNDYYSLLSCFTTKSR